jgi:hypothetical protein
MISRVKISMLLKEKGIRSLNGYRTGKNQEVIPTEPMPYCRSEIRYGPQTKNDFTA